jgi:hypothetical protein
MFSGHALGQIRKPQRTLKYYSIEMKEDYRRSGTVWAERFLPDLDLVSFSAIDALFFWGNVFFCRLYVVNGQIRGGLKSIRELKVTRMDWETFGRQSGRDNQSPRQTSLRFTHLERVTLVDLKDCVATSSQEIRQMEEYKRQRVQFFVGDNGGGQMVCFVSPNVKIRASQSMKL